MKYLLSLKNSLKTNKTLIYSLNKFSTKPKVCESLMNKQQEEQTEVSQELIKKLTSDSMQFMQKNSNNLKIDSQSLNQKRLSSSSSSDSNKSNKKPTLEDLLIIKEKLTRHLPNFLNESHPYNLYTPDVVFENFYKEPGKITVGALQYAIQLTMLRMKVHWKFSHARLEVLKITHDESDGTIKIRWRIVGIRGLKSMIQPWKVKAWKVEESVKNEAEWHDGFSILYVRGDGLIYKHTLERVMSQKDEEPVLVKKDKKLKLENLDVGPTICNK